MQTKICLSTGAVNQCAVATHTHSKRFNEVLEGTMALQYKEIKCVIYIL